ncbi:unnamed protein product [Mytilus coruscus]|uniref:Uncharacterized protein n=1 Tax=Mytilus coruscus TaxID=42192 RepID=A0A6J8D0P3_MYTCO|nr:unnamed protein product [Mytilus coruscus]
MTNLRLLRIPDSKCSKPCGGNASQYCGGWLKLSLYKINIFAESTSSIVNINSTPMTALPSTITTSHSNTTQSTTDTSASISIDTSPLISTAESTVSMYANTITNLPLTTNSEVETSIVNMNENICWCLSINVCSPAFKEKVECLTKEIAIDNKLTSSHINSKYQYKIKERHLKRWEWWAFSAFVFHWL